jgi:teichuronic acid biosynthesis glycosyltransferase TuaC
LATAESVHAVGGRDLAAPRILFVSSLCSTPLLPNRSPGNARILRALRRLVPCRMIIPVRYYPKLAARLKPALQSLIDVPRVEVDDEGTELLHPRMVHLPTVGRSLYGALYAASLYATIRAEIARFRPDVLLSAFAYPDGTAMVALGERFGLPVVVRTMGGDIHEAPKGRLRRPQISWALRRARRTIAVSAAMGREVEALGVPANQVVVIPTGVDTTVFRPIPRDQARAALGLPAEGPVLVAAARLSSEKGLNYLLDALPRVTSGAPPRLLLVGDGAEKAALSAQAARLGLADRVRFEGWQPEGRMHLYYSAADLACLPSLSEGWPDAVMESFACGCPVVASRVGGVPDIVALTGAGILVARGDAGALAAGLSEGLARPWRRDETAQIMQQHTLAQTAQRYLDTCRDAVTAFRAVPAAVTG